MTDFPTKELCQNLTPFYYYDLNLLRSTLKVIKETGTNPQYKVHYAVKANSNPIILKEIAAAGFGADCVSGGEIKAALYAGFPSKDIVYAGVGKSDEEIKLGLSKNIGCFNVESVEELEIIDQIAASCGKVANIALRVNPDIDAHTHEYITTGLAENKFGIALESLDSAIEKALALKNVTLTGLHFHIGSQITIMEPFKLLCKKINFLTEKYFSKGVLFKTINVGGGLGIDYDQPDKNPIPDFKSYFEVFSENLNLRPDQELHFELGRSVVGQCGSLITKVLYVKKGLTKQFAIVDAGFTDLIRPALYGAHHVIQNTTSDGPTETYDVVGPICESSDCFGKNESLPLTRRGDLLALRSAGAYGEIMASQYNCRRLPGAIFSGN